MFKKIVLVVVILLVVIQFFQPEKNISKEVTEQDFIVMTNPPKEVADILKTSCYDCHSNDTQYPWYGNVAPVSYFLANHVNEGKEHLNFSEWGAYNNHQKEHALEEIIEEVEERHMPLTSYINMHEDAAMTDTEIKVLSSYLTTARDLTELQKERAQ